MSARLWPNSDIRTWAPFSWSRRILGVQAWGPSGTVVRSRGSHDSIWGTKGPFKSRPRCIGAERPRTQIQVESNLSPSSGRVLYELAKVTSSYTKLPDDGDQTETCWSCFNVNFDTPFLQQFSFASVGDKKKLT